jgi:serine/threonine-protein kinase RIM15
MANNGTETPKFLAPPAVMALRQEARDASPRRILMERSVSEDIRAEREDLREAAEQTLNVILDLGLDGRIRWVSPSWKRVVGFPLESVEGQRISDILPSNQTVFQDAMESMKEDDSRSRFIRFTVRMGPDSVLRYSPEQLQEGDIEAKEDRPVESNVERELQAERENDHGDLLNMEAQGIMVYDSSADGDGHVSGIWSGSWVYRC